MRTNSHPAIAAATAAAIALTSASFNPASAAPVTRTQAVAAAGITDVAWRRHHHRRANRAVLGAVLGLFGTIATLAAREHDNRHYGYGRYYAPYPPPPPYRYYYRPYY